jgi:hypothetical protein
VIDDLLGDRAQLAVHPAGAVTQHRERGRVIDPFAGHDDPLGLPDDVPTIDRGGQLLLPLCCLERDRGMGSEDRCDAAVGVVECVHRSSRARSPVSNTWW